MPYKYYLHSPSAVLKWHSEAIMLNIDSQKTCQHHEPLDVMHSSLKCITSLQATSEKPQMSKILPNNRSVLFKFQGHER